MKHSRDYTTCSSISNTPHLEAIFGSSVRHWKSKNRTRFHGGSKNKKGCVCISSSYLWGFL